MAELQLQQHRIARDFRKGVLLGSLVVGLFAFNFVAMKIAVRELDPTFVGFGRAIIAAIPAAILLLLSRQPLPGRRLWGPLVVTAITAVIGFSLFLALALEEVSGNYAAIILGLAPIATAVFGSWRERERHAAVFWWAALAGSVAVFAYALSVGSHRITWHDGALLLAVASAAIGYTEGARISRELGSWQVICWALVISVPFLIYPTLRAMQGAEFQASGLAWAGLLYAGLGSLFIGYMIWYKALKLGGIARIGQIQLLQPFAGLGFCAWLLGEPVTVPMVACATFVLLCVFVTQRSRRLESGR